MSKTCKTWAEVEAYLTEKINSSLQKEMSEMVKDKIEEHVQTDVYDTYPNPVMYERRNFQNGSLGDIIQMDSKLISDGVLEVTDNADFNHSFAYTYGGYGDIDISKSLTYNIEKGYGSEDMPWNEARPFIENTREEIQNSNLHSETMKKALRARGLDVV